MENNNIIYLPNKNGDYVETKIPKYIIELLPRMVL